MGRNDLAIIGFSLMLSLIPILMIVLGVVMCCEGSDNNTEVNKTELVSDKDLTTVSNYPKAIVLEKYEEKRPDTADIITNPTNRNYFLTLKKYRKGSFGHWNVFTIRVSRFEYIKYNPGDTIR